MGMAASQARFLGLTARKNNVEYEGQQINQQRTALSNQSGSYYTNLLGMNVPQPPSVQDYTKTIYAFSDGALNNQLTSLIAHADGSYTVSYIRNYTDNDAIVSAVPSRVTRNTETEKETTYTDADGNPLYLKDGKYYTDEDCLLEFTGDTAGITEKETEKTTTTGYAVGGTLLNNVFSKEEITDEDLADNARDDIMAYVITDACVSCGACAEQCPVEAISEGDGKYVIDADVCVSCGSCAEQCPNEAIEEG